jgi:hypothetical protein
MTDRGPLFLAGIDRSGIGLLGEVLEAHPDIAVTRRVNFWSFYNDRYGDLSDEANLDRCLADMMSYTRISRLQPQWPLLRRDFLAGERTYARLFALLQEQNMRRLGKSRWADKSLNAEGSARAILEAFPNGKMIHVLRDPRDRYASQLTHRGSRRGKVGGGTALWLWSARLAENNARDFAGRYKVVQYEHMVRHPEAFLRELCLFMDQEYSPQMLTMEPAGDGEAAGAGADRAQRHFWTTSIGRYGSTLSERDVAFIQLYTAREMGRYGYQPDIIQMSPAGKATYYAINVPVNSVRLLLARWQSAVRDRAGRTPSDRRLADLTAVASR